MFDNWPSTPTKATLIHEDDDGQKATYQVGRYKVTVRFDGTACDQSVLYQADGWSSQSNPQRTLPNMEIVDGMLRVPISDFVGTILSRAEPVELAEALFEDEDVRRHMVEGLAQRYSQCGFNDPDRRRFLAQVKEAVHDAALDKLRDEIASMEWHNSQRYYANSSVDHVNRWLHEQGIDKRVPHEPDAEDFRCTGKVWQQARDDWRQIVTASFPPPVVPKRPELGAFDPPPADWLADEPEPEVKRLREALQTAEAEARRYAEFYPQSSDGRNTFILLADRIAGLGAEP